MLLKYWISEYHLRLHKFLRLSSIVFVISSPSVLPTSSSLKSGDISIPVGTSSSSLWFVIPLLYRLTDHRVTGDQRSRCKGYSSHLIASHRIGNHEITKLVCDSVFVGRFLPFRWAATIPTNRNVSRNTVSSLGDTNHCTSETGNNESEPSGIWCVSSPPPPLLASSQYYTDPPSPRRVAVGRRLAPRCPDSPTDAGWIRPAGRPDSPDMPALRFL